MPNFPARNLTNLYISLSYSDVVQTYVQNTASYFLDGLGNVLLFIPTSSVGQQILTIDQPAPLAITSSYALSSTFTDSASIAIESIFADSASFSAFATYADSASYSPIQLPDITDDTINHKIGINNPSPQYALDIIGDIQVSDSFINADGVYGFTTTDTGNGNSFVCNGQGQFGVGTNNPQYELDVSGSINATGNYLQYGLPYTASLATVATTIYSSANSQMIASGGIYISAQTFGIGIYSQDVLTLESIGGDVNISSDNGNINLSAPNGGDVNISSDNGNINLSAPNGSVTSTPITASLYGTASYTLIAGAINFTPNASLFTTQSLFSTQSLYATQSINAYSASWVSASAFITTAQTASYVTASNIVGTVSSASVAKTSSYATSASYAPSNGVQTTQSVILTNSQSVYQLLSYSTASIMLGTFTYAVKSGSNSRAGTICSTWNGTQTVFTDTSTADIGNTSDISMSIVLNNNNLILYTAASSSLNWICSAIGTYL